MTGDFLPKGLPSILKAVVPQLTPEALASWEQTSEPSEKCMSQFMLMEKLFQILEEAGYDLYAGVPICIEPASSANAKISAGKIAETWDLFLWRHPTLHTPMWEIKRPKGDLFRISTVYNLAGGYYLPLVEEEPTADAEKVGQFILKVCDGYVETVVVQGPDKMSHLAMVGGSLTKVGNEIPPDAKFLGLYLSNFQRLYGRKILGGAPIPVYMQEVDELPDIDNSKFGSAPEGGWTLANMPNGFRKLVKITKLPKMTRDGRALACIAMYLAEMETPSNIYDKVSTIATFAGLSVKEAGGFIKLSQPEREEFERLLAFKEKQ